MTPVSHRWLQYQRMVVGHSKSHEAQMDDERSIIPTIETIRTCLSHLSLVRHLVCCPVQYAAAQQYGSPSGTRLAYSCTRDEEQPLRRRFGSSPWCLAWAPTAHLPTATTASSSEGNETLGVPEGCRDTASAGPDLNSAPHCRSTVDLRWCHTCQPVRRCSGISAVNLTVCSG